jgi:soluble lytic murein transglycosylase
MEAKALYWRARGLGRLGRVDAAVDGYRYVIERFPLTYYAVMSYHRIGGLGVSPEEAVPFMPRLAAPFDPTMVGEVSAIEVPLHPRVRRGVALWARGDRDRAKEELHAQLQFRGVPRGVVELLGSFHAADGDYSAAHWVVSRYGDFRVGPYGGNARLWALAHPLPPALWSAAKQAAAETSMDPALAMGVIRHESGFKPSVVSHRGAVGVMQLMPGTARSVFSKWYGKPGLKRRALYKVETNIRAGLAMFALLQQVYRGNTPLMIAAYNAGPGVASRWWRDGEGLQTDALVEEMTYPGTVAYLKKVIGSWYVYRVLYGDGEPPPVPLALPESLGDWARPTPELLGHLDTSQAME